ncbi:MAG TPA: L-type lectin-domain containing protein, partial [Flavilitoribacter sp.]|nr:L-type lectin-domain containing protein [Flavilitoribacter sp.]
MKAFLTSAGNLIPAICLVVSLLAIPEAFSQNYVLNGSAVDLGSGCYRLTPQATAQSGSVWYQNKLSLASDFSIKAELNFGFLDFNGADGIGFVLQPICNGLGQSGGGLGFGGISPSLAVEFDTYQNSFAPENYNDPFEDHIALQQNGNLKHDSTLNLAGPVIMPNLEDGLDHSVVIVWNAATQTFTVDFDGANVITYTGDIVADIFGGNAEVFWGFTAATG